MSVTAAGQALVQAGFHVRDGSSLIDGNVPKGDVVSVSPSGRALPGATIIVTGSLGPRMITVPHVAGKSMADATAALKAAGLTVSSTTKAVGVTGNVVVNSVAGTTPAEGTSWPQNRPVYIDVVTGLTLPPLTGEDIGTIQQWASTNNIHLQSTNVSSDKPQGVIVAQSPAAGAIVAPGGTVSVSVSQDRRWHRSPTTWLASRSSRCSRRSRALASLLSARSTSSVTRSSAPARRERPLRAPRSPCTTAGSNGLMALIGSHATVTGGLATGGLGYAAEVGAEVIQVFASNPRGWAAGPGDTAQDRALRESGLPVFIHAPYLINLGAGDPSVARKSADAIAHALRRGGEIGARGVVVHTGSAAGWTDGVEGAARESALRQIREIVLPLLDKLGDEDPDLLLEPMAGQGQMLCARAGDLEAYLDTLERHPRAGVCLDTCHMFAAGHDLTAEGGVRMLSL